MAHFAQIDDTSTVLQVIVISDAQEAQGETYCHGLFGGQWKQTSYNTYAGVHQTGGQPRRKNYAGIGYHYDATRDAFVPPQPFPSWELDEDTCQWEAPLPYPGETEDLSIGYQWDEATRQWARSARISFLASPLAPTEILEGQPR